MLTTIDDLEKTIDCVFDDEGDEAFTPRKKKDEFDNADFNRNSYVNMEVNNRAGEKEREGGRERM